MPEAVGLRLEKYTLQHKKEVLLVNLETADGEPDTVMIYAGFSSSLMRATDFDPDIPLIAADSNIISVDILASPYDPSNPIYIKSGLTIEEILGILHDNNL